MAGKKSGTRKKTGMSEFQKMVKALKLSKDEIADMLGHTRLNPETGMREHRKGGGKVVKAKFGTTGLLAKAAKEKKSYKAMADKLKARKSKPKKTTRSEAKLVEGAGDMSDPTNRAGRMRTGKQQRRGGATSQSKDAMSDTEKDRLARGKAGRGSYKRSQKLKKGSLAQLSDEYDKLLKGRQRAERLKGSESKFYKVFKARKMKGLKTGGPVVKAKFGTSGLLAGMAGMGSGAKAMAKKPKRKIIKKKSKKKPTTPTYKRKKDPTQMSPSEYNIMMRKRKIEKDQDLRGADDPRNYPGKPFSNVKEQADKKRNLKRKGGGLVGGQKKLDVNKDGKITGSDFEMLKMNKKKYGGKISYRMKGGQVVDAGYD
mgnify:CR=1 FL=1|jgi:hypothetical protein